MSRPLEPEKRERLLEQCFAAALRDGSLEMTLESLARTVGTSARMLLYHFGSKHALDAALVSRLESRLRERFVTMHRTVEGTPKSLLQVALAVWDDVSAPPARGLLRLAEDLRRRALAGDVIAARVVRADRDAWEQLLASAGLTRGAGLAVLLLAEGAAADLLLTDDPERGRHAFHALLGGHHDAP